MKSLGKTASCLMLAALTTSAAFAASTVPGSPQSPVTTDNFLLRNTADLVSLCSAQAEDPNRIAAIHFCEGFILGVRHYDDVSAASLQSRFYCHPERSTRDEAVRLYVKYHREHPEFQGESAIDGVIRAAMALWPCPQSAAETSPHSSRKGSK